MSKIIRGPQRRIRRTRTPEQQKRQRSYRTCCTYWNVSTTDATRELWNRYGTDRQTAFNAFLSINLVRVYNDLPVLALPPDEV